MMSDLILQLSTLNPQPDLTPHPYPDTIMSVGPAYS